MYIIMKLDRLFGITNILLDRGNVTATELAAEFGVSVRTIYRDLDVLSANGVPVYATQGKGGGISLMDHYSLDKSLLSDEEQKEILLALQSMTAVNALTGESAARKLKGLFQKSETNWIEIDFSGWGESNQAKNLFEMIRSAIQKRQPLTFEYSGSSGTRTERTAEPLKLVFKQQTWYLYAFCRLRQDYRFFKLSRVKNVRLLDEQFSREMPNTISKVYHTPQYGERVSMKLKIDLSLSYRVYDDFLPNEISRTENCFIVETLLYRNEYTYNYLLSFGKHLEILEPEEVRNEYKNHIKNILKNYL